MNVGIDIDDTITACPEIFAILTRGLKNNGHNVFILTFRDEKKYRFSTEKELQALGIEYDKLFMGEHIVDPALKVRIAIENKIDIMFEDNADVLNAMPKNIQCIYMIPKDLRAQVTMGDIPWDE